MMPGHERHLILQLFPCSGLWWLVLAVHSTGLR